jgi:nucleoid-associated protein YgaU
MRWTGFRRCLAVWILAAGVPVFFGACASSKPDDGALEAEEASEGQDAANDQEQAENSENVVEEATPNETVANGGPVQDDLQGIISEMNNSPTEAAAMATADGAGSNQATSVATAGTPQPSDAAVAGALPEMGAKMSYIVQPGDTLGKIAGKIYGDMNLWKELAQLSGLANPSRIYPGDLIYYQLTERSISFAKNYEAIAKTEVIVKSGDTLAKIAAKAYGDSRSWKAIWRLNDEVSNPDELVVGQAIVLISSEAFKTGMNDNNKHNIEGFAGKKITKTNSNIGSESTILLAKNHVSTGDFFDGALASRCAALMAVRVIS